MKTLNRTASRSRNKYLVQNFINSLSNYRDGFLPKLKNIPAVSFSPFTVNKPHSLVETRQESENRNRLTASCKHVKRLKRKLNSPFSFLIQLFQHKFAVSSPTNHVKLVKEVFCCLKNEIEKPETRVHFQPFG